VKQRRQPSAHASPIPGGEVNIGRQLDAVARLDHHVFGDLNLEHA
jgi:hypothetical protein